jgi:hypothetical protein
MRASCVFSSVSSCAIIADPRENRMSFANCEGWRPAEKPSLGSYLPDTRVHSEETAPFLH